MDEMDMLDFLLISGELDEELNEEEPEDELDKFLNEETNFDLFQ